MPCEIEKVNGIKTTVKKTGKDSSNLLKFICVIFLNISEPTIIKIGAVA